MIKIHFFAGLTRIFPKSIDSDIKATATVSDLMEELKVNYPDAKDLLTRSRVAINESFVDLTTPLQENMEVFIIPPSSGG